MKIMNGDAARIMAAADILNKMIDVPYKGGDVDIEEINEESGLQLTGDYTNALEIWGDLNNSEDRMKFLM